MAGDGAARHSVDGDAVPALPVSDETGANKSCGRFRPIPCRTVAQTVATTIRVLLEENATDGAIRLEDACRILDHVADAGGALETYLNSRVRKCRRSLWQRGDATGRSHPFHRLLTRPLEPLLNGEEAAFPREYLPNVLTFAESVLGGKRVAKYDARCREIFQSLVVEFGHSMSWEHFHADRRSIHLLAHVLDRLVAALDSPDGQWAWLSTMTTGASVPSDEQAMLVRQVLISTHRALSGQTGPLDEPG